MGTEREKDRLARLRRTYTAATLSESDVAPDPFSQFRRWLDDAVTAELLEPNAMVLSTVAADGTPSGRTVLLKGLDHGFVLYTNHGSRKGREMLANPHASLVFPWFAMDRQVVVAGTAEQVDRETTGAYFRSRPRESQLGAWASDQSTVVPDRRHLDDRYAEVAHRWPEGTRIPVPDNWGGFRVVPSTVELWQGRVGRLHDRLRYVRLAPSADGPGEWRVERLAP